VLGGRTGGGNDDFGGSPPNGAGAGSGVCSTFAGDVGKIDIAGEEIIGTVPTGGAGGGNISNGSDVVIKPFAPAERGVSSGVTRGVG